MSRPIPVLATANLDEVFAVVRALYERGYEVDGFHDFGDLRNTMIKEIASGTRVPHHIMVADRYIYYLREPYEHVVGGTPVNSLNHLIRYLGLKA